jgi:hypothetical protein
VGLVVRTTDWCVCVLGREHVRGHFLREMEYQSLINTSSVIILIHTMCFWLAMDSESCLHSNAFRRLISNSRSCNAGEAELSYRIGMDVAEDRCGDSSTPEYRAQVANILHRYPSL